MQQLLDGVQVYHGAGTPRAAPGQQQAGAVVQTERHQILYHLAHYQRSHETEHPVGDVPGAAPRVAGAVGHEDVVGVPPVGVLPLVGRKDATNWKRLWMWIDRNAVKFALRRGRKDEGLTVSRFGPLRRRHVVSLAQPTVLAALVVVTVPTAFEEDDPPLAPQEFAEVESEGRNKVRSTPRGNYSYIFGVRNVSLRNLPRLRAVVAGY